MELADISAADNLVNLFLARADALGDAPFLAAKRDGGWHTTSWAESARQVCLIAQNLVALGLDRGDRVMLVAENRPEWCLADLGVMAAGCITVPTYVTNTERDHLHILTNSGARAVIVSTAKLARPLLPAIMRSGLAEHVIGMETIRPTQTDAFVAHGWAQLLEGDAAAARIAVEARMAGVARTDTACIIYTSGTGGAPRGVMQHHGAILANVFGAATVLQEDFGLGRERFLSFLPLSHAYEHTGGQYLPLSIGAEIYYAEGLEKLASNIEETQPTVMVVVPRLFEVLRTRIIKQVEKQGGLAAGLLGRATRLAARNAGGSGGGKVRLVDRPLDFVIERTLRPKIRARFGGRLKAMVSGGAPLNPEVGTFFQAVGLIILQGYGQTEAGPIVACNRPAAGIAMATVGPPLAGVEVRIAADGEILVRGELVMHGYWQAPQATAAALRDGWLHTGDIGHVDEAGRVVITDRKKDMIVNDKGENVAPQKVEGMLTLCPEIAQAMVAGDRRPYIVGLVVPDGEWMAEWAAANGLASRGAGDLAFLRDHPPFRTALRAAIDRVNADLSVTEKVRQFALADEPFGIENGEMTPSMKIRRHKIRDRYGDRLAGLYRG